MGAEAFSGVLNGFHTVFHPINIFVCFIGCLLGTLVGVLPGLGPTSAISLLLPITFRADPVSAIIMLAGIYYGAMYGGSTTSILVNIPGEPSSVVTCLDGYPMAQQGRAGAALGISAFGSFIAGTVAIVGLTFFAPVLSRVALRFGPAENVGIIVLSLTLLAFLAHGSMVRALMMAALGLMLGTVGTDLITGKSRFSYGIGILTDGIGLIPFVVGMFGVGEVLLNLETSMRREILKTGFKGLFPSLKDWKASTLPMIRATVIGFFLGILPGIGAIIPTFISYSVEKRLSKHPEKFGTGIIEGVAGPETANNAAAGAAFIPMFSLGIPPNAVMAVLLGALMIHGVQPGPQFISGHPDLFWAVVASMYIGNVMLLVLNLPLIPLWVQILKVPYSLLFSLILLFCLIGTYTVNNNPVDIVVMVVFGFVGYLVKKYRYEVSPLILAFVLGPILEKNVRQALIISRGSFAVFFTHPISLVFFTVAVLILVVPLLRRGRTRTKPKGPLPEDDGWRRFDGSSLFLFFFSFLICIESYRMDLGTLSVPGPGLFPFGAGLILGLLCTISALKSSFRGETGEPLGSGSKYRILLVLCGLTAYGMLLERTGFLVTTFGLLLFLLKVIVPQGWARVLCAAILSTLASYVIFEIWLRAQLPRGLLGF